MKSSEFRFSNPNDAIRTWCDAVTPIGRRVSAPLAQSHGRILAESVVSDRPSPPCSVSAMDGYVLRMADLKAGRIDVAGEIAIGREPPELPPGWAMRIFTGAPIPEAGEVVLKREDVEEHESYINLSADTCAQYSKGDNVRYVGENLPAGTTVIEAGKQVELPVVASLAGFGIPQVTLFGQIRVTVLTTGDELRSPEDQDPQPWEIRNSNGPALGAFLSSIPWINLLEVDHVVDDPSQTRARIERAVAESDAVVITGGVSMGDHDYVPGAVRECGGHVVFHKLPVRPGKPLLAAVGPDGQVIAGLPGNPVSVMVAIRRTVLPVLAKRSGAFRPANSQPMVQLTAPLDRGLHLWWYLPTRLVEGGMAEVVSTKGSGDFAAVARSDGFVEIPCHETGVGPWPFWAWAST